MILLAAGCAEVRPDEPSYRVVAVLPFADRTGGSFDGDEFANILASELVKAGFRVIRPAQIGAPVTTADEAIRIARRHRADVILACAITEYDPYDPPKVAISAQFLRVEAGPRSGEDLDRMLQSGSWHRGPLSMSRDRAGHALAAFEEVYDSRDRETRRALHEYIEGRAESEREILAVQSRYLQFVSNRMIQRVLHGS
jgi:hypothetical protein